MQSMQGDDRKHGRNRESQREERGCKQGHGQFACHHDGSGQDKLPERSHGDHALDIRARRKHAPILAARRPPPELSRDRVEDARTLLKVGDEVEAKFTAVDRKVRTIALSIKAKDMAEEQEAMQAYRSDSSTGTSLGDLLKEQISGQ